MTSGDQKAPSARKDAEALEDKFGAFAAVYAQARSEAAEIAGDTAGEDHWEAVAESLEENDR